MGGSAQWDLQRADFAPDFDIIPLDLPGFGANNHLPAISSIGGFADWVVAELRAMGVARYHLMGHSMGGMIVQEMVRQDSDRIDKLILYGTGAVGVLPGRFETIEQSKTRAEADGVPRTARRISATWFLDEERAEPFEACASIAQQASAAAVMAGLDAMKAWSGVDHLAEIKKRTLVIWGDKDRTYPWSQIERLWSSVPDASLAVAPGCAHAIHLEKAALFNALVRDFLLEP